MNGGHTTLSEESLYRVTVGERRREGEWRLAKVTRLELRAL
jgi:hypothetical protein